MSISSTSHIQQQATSNNLSIGEDKEKPDLTAFSKALMELEQQNLSSKEFDAKRKAEIAVHKELTKLYQAVAHQGEAAKEKWLKEISSKLIAAGQAEQALLLLDNCSSADTRSDLAVQAFRCMMKNDEYIYRLFTKRKDALYDRFIDQKFLEQIAKIYTDIRNAEFFSGFALKAAEKGLYPQAQHFLLKVKALRADLYQDSLLAIIEIGINRRDFAYALNYLKEIKLEKWQDNQIVDLAKLAAKNAAYDLSIRLLTLIQDLPLRKETTDKILAAIQKQVMGVQLDDKKSQVT